MVDLHPTSLDNVFHALADPTRRAMLRALDRGEMTVTALAAPFSMSLAAASKHVRTLEQAGLIRRHIQGRTHRCRLEAKPLAAAMGWLRRYERFWNERLDDLERALEQAEAPDEEEESHAG